MNAGKLIVSQSEDWIYGQTPQFEFSTSGVDGEALAEKDKWPLPQGVRFLLSIFQFLY